MSRHKMFVASDKAGRELGYAAGPVEKALESAVRWYETHGYVSAQKSAGERSAVRAAA